MMTSLHLHFVVISCFQFSQKPLEFASKRGAQTLLKPVLLFSKQEGNFKYAHVKIAAMELTAYLLCDQVILCLKKCRLSANSF